MDNLEIYLVTIQNKDCDQFDLVLSRISRESGIRFNKRLLRIIPMSEETIYEVCLSNEEAAILILSCPGEYIRRVHLPSCSEI